MKKFLIILFTIITTLLISKIDVKGEREKITLNTNNEVIWAKGVDNFKVNGPDSEFICYPEVHGDKTYHEYYIPYQPNRGYYDINKTYDKDSFLCFAASASSTLTWWFSQNYELINKYVEENPNINHIDEVKKFQTLPTSQYDSIIFNHFTEQYAYRQTGYWPDLLIDHFLNGYKPKENGGVNDEDWLDGDNLLINGPARGGGFFFELLNKRKLTTRTQVNYNDFNNTVKNTLRNDGIISMTYESGNLAHVVTLWGAEIGTDGNVKAVYYNDSDDDKMYGLKRIEVYNKNNNAYITTDIDHKSGSWVSMLNTLRLGQEFFGVHSHNYGEPKWNLNDPMNPTATFTCKDDPTHTETVKAKVKEYRVDASCSKVGKTYKVAEALFNGKTYKSQEYDQIEIAKKEHNFTDYVIDINPTCNNEGEKSRTCQVCGYKEKVIIPKLEHRFTPFEETIKATCDKDGEASRHCEHCNLTETKVIPKLEHKYGDYQIVVNPTCTKEGKKCRTCVNCNHKDELIIPKLEHISDNIWHFHNDTHFHLCTNGCGTKLDLENCHGGSATINDKPICDICHNKYGNVLENIELPVKNNKLDYNINDNNNLTIDLNNNLLEIKINDETLDNNYYFIENNKLIIKKEYLDTLTNETYNIKLQFDNGYSNIKLNIVSKNNNLNMIIIITSVSISLVAIGVIGYLFYRKKHLNS